MSHTSSSAHVRRLSAVIIVIGTFIGAASMSTASATPVGTIIDYEQTVSAVIPQGSFGGAAGGDGWTLAFTDANVYNIFHHDVLSIACRSKTTGVACSGSGYSAAGTKTVSDGANRLLVAMGPPLHIDKMTNRLYTMAVRETSGTLSGTGGTTGVVEIDLASTSANPFVAFYPLSRDGEGGCYLNTCRTVSVVSSTISNVAKIGTKWYVYNYVSGVANTVLPDSRNKLLCFDLATKSPCANQPYDVTRSNVVQGRLWHPPTIAAIGNRVFVGIYSTADAFTLGGVSCVDMSSTPTNCTGWPIVPATQFAGSTFTMAPPFPLLNSTGTPIGVCFPGNPTNACTDFTGATAAVDPDLAGLATPFNVDWATTRGEAFVDGTRIFMPNVVLANGTSQVECYDFSTDNLCANFPQAGVSQPKTFVLSELESVYTIQTDPSDPSCLWLMGHGGTRQIQNFDAQTGGACGANGFVLPINNFRENVSRCTATAWKQFELVTPTTGNFTSGTVEFVDSNGAAISGLTTQSFGANGILDLTSLNLHSYPSFSRMHVRLVGTVTRAISVKMRWASEYHPECVVSGQTAFTSTPASSTTSVPVTTTVVTAAPTVAVTTVAPAVTATTSTAPPTTSSPIATTALPLTGVDRSTTLTWALLLIVSGALTMVVGSRRRAPQR